MAIVTFKDKLTVSTVKEDIRKTINTLEEDYCLVERITKALEKYNGKKFTRRITNKVSEELNLRIGYTDQFNSPQLVIYLSNTSKNITFYIRETIEKGVWDHATFVKNHFRSYEGNLETAKIMKKSLTKVGSMVKRYNALLKEAQELVSEAEDLKLGSGTFDIASNR